jgi:protein-tyrosine phosphatase
MDSVDLARALVDQGVEAVLCTPHFSLRFPTQQILVRSRHAELERTLSELRIDLRTELGAEVGSGLALSVPAEELQARAVHGFLLVELEPPVAASAPRAIVERLAPMDLTPIFAHPERSRAVRDDPQLVGDVRAEGALVQVVASSLAGRWGEPIARAAWRLLDEGYVDVLASDAHSATGSVRELRAVVEHATRRYGAAAVATLTMTNPARILALRAARAG